MTDLLFEAEANSEEHLKTLIPLIAKIIEKDSIVLLSGDLSAGKTTFVSYFCNFFGLKMIQSPTYAIHQRYSNSDICVDHFDLYRLENKDQIESSGFYDTLNQSSDYKFIEWPERINTNDLPIQKKIFRIVFKIKSDKSRKINIFSLN